MEEIPNNHLGCIKPCKQWDKLPTSSGAGILPSTVVVVKMKKIEVSPPRNRINSRSCTNASHLEDHPI